MGATNYAIIIIIGGAILGFGLTRFLKSKTGIIKPKEKGQKRQYYTVGGLIIFRIKERHREWRDKYVKPNIR